MSFFGGWVAEGAKLQPAANIAKKRSRRRKATSRAAGALKLMTWEKLGCAGASERREAPRRTQETDRKKAQSTTRKRKKCRGNLKNCLCLSPFHLSIISCSRNFPCRHCAAAVCDSAHPKWGFGTNVRTVVYRVNHHNIPAPGRKAKIVSEHGGCFSSARQRAHAQFLFQPEEGDKKNKSATWVFSA